MLALLMLAGCVAPQRPAAPPPDPLLSDPSVIRLECRAAHQQGCRHKGNILPWGAWVDYMGYDAKDYEIKKIVQIGPRGTVLLLPR